MKASSESGECASLISRASVDVFEVACPLMGLVVPFVPRSWDSLYTRQARLSKRSLRQARNLLLPRPVACVEAVYLAIWNSCGTRTRGREQHWNLRGTC